MSVFTPERHLRACVQEPARRGVWGCLGSGAYVLPIPALLCFLLHSNLGLGGVLGIDDLRDAEGGGWGGGGPLSPGARVFWCHFSRPVSWDSRLLGHWAPDGASGRTGEAGPGPALVSLLWNPPPKLRIWGSWPPVSLLLKQLSVGCGILHPLGSQGPPLVLRKGKPRACSLPPPTKLATAPEADQLAFN